ncbi:hypothetical protein [Streptomyces sp. NPDC001601]|uniref:hypothetical protein n=1 Tax=Streptomyces sp. NPDC001601 TaxID=3364592 RepID=UPI0036811E7A
MLFALLLDTGVRDGEALGLRHDDIAIAENQVTVVPRQNDNRPARIPHRDPRPRSGRRRLRRRRALTREVKCGRGEPASI